MSTRFLVLVCIVLWPLDLARSAKRDEAQALRIAQQGADGWTVEYRYMPVRSTQLEIDGKPHLLFLAEAEPEGVRQGQPLLPALVLSLGIPFGDSLTAEITKSTFATLQNQLVAPVPEYRYTEEDEAIAVYSKDQRAYATDAFFPSRLLTIDPPFTLRQQRMVTLRLSPYQYNPVSRVLRHLVSATLTVRRIRASSAGESSPAESAASPDPYFEGLYKSLLSNYGQAKDWRVLSRPGPGHFPDSTRDWFELGRDYYRVPIGSDGWQKVTQADLATAGANIYGIDPATVRVFSRGLEIPCVVRADTSIEFYARRNYGDTTYYNFYTDTSAYFLTWGGAGGKRFSVTPQPVGTPTQVRQSAKVRNHLEVNSYYYRGATEQEISTNSNTPGKGWTWGGPPEFFFPNTIRTYSFDVDQIDTANATGGLRVRLFGTTSPYPPVSHHARFWINDSLVGDRMFPQRTEGLLDTTFPIGWLKPGSNVLKIQSLPTEAGPNQFYLDWFEVEYQRFLRALNNQLLFTTPAYVTGGPVRFEAGGFSRRAIEVYDLANGRVIPGGTVTGDSLSGFSVSFNDTLSQARTYIVLDTSGHYPVPPMSRKRFTDIRQSPAGADLIIITHRDFSPAAEQLAAHRRSQNGIRVGVIDVQDIYDEFNYGVAKAEGIKDFVRYAFNYWPDPAPSHLLLFGDASRDPHRYMSTSVKTDYVPAYGIPESDNWYACFDSAYAFVPSMFVGRLPVQSLIQAQHTVAKVIGYDSYPVDDWNKNFLFVSGGTDSVYEQPRFNSLSDGLVSAYVVPFPIGGTAFRVYKKTIAVIDGENKQLMKELVADGLVFINFLGHSGGRLWNVDIGPPNDLQNTNGKLPFVSSVSCNVGAFAEPAGNVLSEDFVLADNRGGIACWSSTSLGYPDLGTRMVSSFLEGVKDDSLRDLGTLTTQARYEAWLGSPYSWQTIASMNQTPLLGDPMSRLALPVKPDLAVRAEDIQVGLLSPTPNDSLIPVRIAVHNYGLMPGDSIRLSVTDLYDGASADVIPERMLPPLAHHDSLTLDWRATSRPGLHTLTATLDPRRNVDDLNPLNNMVSVETYVYANNIAVVKPLNNQVMVPGPVTLIVSSPLGLDSAGFNYTYELDTVATFDSPARMVSGPVQPGPAAGSWTTPALPAGRVYFWRARASYGDLLGRWMVSSFSTDADAPPLPSIRLRENTRRQFERDVLQHATVTDSGVSIAPTPPTRLLSRSLGYRANPDKDYYSIIKVNEQTAYGHWWVLGSGFMALRLNQFNGAYDFMAFNTASDPAQADSMRSFIENTAGGNYIAISVIFDGRTNVTESLYQTLEALGSTMIRSVQPGESWAFIGRKGMPSAALESHTFDSATVSLVIPNYYSSGFGTFTTGLIPIANSWDSFQWEWGGPASQTDIRAALLGVRNAASQDTLRMLPSDSTDVSLLFLNTLTSGPTYTALKVAVLMSTSDALVSPAVRSWSMGFSASADLAISAQSVGQGATQQAGTLGLPVRVYNIGFIPVDSARIVVSVYDKLNKARPITYAEVGAIPVGGNTSVVVPINTRNFPRRATLQIEVSPPKNAKDLVTENNVAYYSFNVVGSQTAAIEVFADGTRLMDGDFVPRSPTLLVRVPVPEEDRITLRRFDMLVDGKPVERSPAPRQSSGSSTRSLEGEEDQFTPLLSDGTHTITVRVAESNSFGDIDTLARSLTVQVLSQSRIMQMFNYPNPFARDTYFTFVLTGEAPPEELSIRVYTIAGRKIKEIIVPRSELQIGFNRVYWDGRDADGDELANGYYLYQATMKAGATTETRIEKLAKLR